MREKIARLPELKRPCATCAKVFRPADIPNRTARHWVYCSKACDDAGRGRAYVDHHAGRNCPACLEALPPYVEGKGRPSKWCERCKQSAKARQNCARRRGAKTIERIYPFEVFRLANWHCQTCGCETPRETLGTNSTNSPELDHIIALSLGGQHKRDNVQLLCRACNLTKGKAERLEARKAA